MRRLFAMSLLSALTLPVMAADQPGSATIEGPGHSPTSWVNAVLPPGAMTPKAIGLHNCLGSYPEAAKTARIEGITALKFRIAEDGTVKKVSLRTSSGDKALDKAAIACVKAWVYQPASLEGKPIAVDWRTDIKWVLTTYTNQYRPAPPPPVAAPPGPPPVNVITTQSRVSNPPPISAPASIGRPHVCLTEYPPDAVAELSQGTVVLGFNIGTDGNVHDIHVVASSGYASLDDAAVNCASVWRYKPAIKDNVPIQVPWKAEVKWLMR